MADNNRIFVLIRDANITAEVEGIMQEVRIKTDDPPEPLDESRMTSYREERVVTILSSYEAR